MEDLETKCHMIFIARTCQSDQGCGPCGVAVGFFFIRF